MNTAKNAQSPFAAVCTSAKVYLLGAGPGGADLLTLRGAKLLAQADIIVYDALVEESIHRLFSPKARLHYVGKRAGQHALRQEEIDTLLIKIAQAEPAGSTIVRLKGGDPFVFGRGGEEMIALRQAGIPYEVVPGVTAGIAAPAYQGIPVTHRALSRSVSLITAFTKEGGLPPLDWSAYVRLDGTLVFYMSMRVVPQIAKALMDAGQSATTPAAIISHGTRPNQHVEALPLGNFTEGRFDYEAFTPGLFVVGEVVSFAKDYAWYEPSPLAGQSILITRSEGQTSELSERFEALGAKPLVLPTFEIEAIQPERMPTELSQPEVSLLALASPNAVHHFVHYLSALGYDTRYLARFRGIAVVGPATEQALSTYGIRPDVVAEPHTAEGLAACIAEYLGGETISVLNPTSSLGGEALTLALRTLGIACQTLTVYNNKPVAYSKEHLEGLLTQQMDWVSFCSSSAVNNFLALLRQHGLEHHLEKLKLSAIGPTTAESIRRAGHIVRAEASKASLTGLVEAMIKADLEAMPSTATDSES